MKTVIIPDILSRITSLKEHRLSGEGNTTREVIINICKQYNVLKPHLLHDNNQLKEHFLFTLNGNLIDPDDPLDDESVIDILLATSGGIDSNQLTNEEIQRYVRHVSLPGVGRSGQLCLKQAKVLIIGAGGLGSPISMYLAACGVGTIGLADSDVVEDTNLQRQIVHGYSTLGMSKVESARNRLLDLNPYIDIRTYPYAVDADNAHDIIGQYDIVVDGTDNFPTRYLINDVCVRLNIPFVCGSIFRFEGQVSVFNLNGGPCYNCLFPESPPAELSPSGRIGGVIGILPGVIGTLEASETIKIILNIGNPLSERLLRFDALKMEFQEIKFKKRKNCPTCGVKRNTGNEKIRDQSKENSKREEIKYNLESENYIEPQELKRLIDKENSEYYLIDVREENELEVCKLPGIIHIPLNMIDDHIKKFDPQKKFIIICYSGARSEHAASQLITAGIDNVQVLSGGMKRWVKDIENDMPIY